MAEAVAALSLAETSPKTCSAHAAIEDDRDALLQNASNPLATSEEAKVNPRDSALIVTRPAETAKECRAPEAAGVPPEEALPSASRDDDLLSSVDPITFECPR